MVDVVNRSAVRLNGDRVTEVASGTGSRDGRL